MIHTLWFSYFWPSLQGNGPEALIQTVVYGLIAMAVYPPLRKWSKRELEKVHGKLDEAHEKMDHIIRYHPDIPPFEGKKS